MLHIALGASLNIFLTKEYACPAIYTFQTVSTVLSILKKIMNSVVNAHLFSLFIMGFVLFAVITAFLVLILPTALNVNQEVGLIKMAFVTSVKR